MPSIARAADYRVAVDEALFGLGARYGPLIELLLQLRKPQIMRDFKADDLSRLLSEALPPLSPRLIENVSVSFRSLESDRQQLTELTEARSSVETFLRLTGTMCVAVRRRAADVRATTADMKARNGRSSGWPISARKMRSLFRRRRPRKARIEEALVTARANGTHPAGQPGDEKRRGLAPCRGDAG